MLENLEKDIYGSLEEEVTEETEGSNAFVSDLETATRYAYRLSKTVEEISKIKSVADLERKKWLDNLAKVDEWEKGQVSNLQSTVDFLQGALSEYHRNQYEQAPKGNTSIKLPYGVTLKSRATPLSYNVQDKDKLKDYAVTVGLVKTPEPVADWSTIKKNLTVVGDNVIDSSTGEVLDFIEVVTPTRKFEVGI